MYGDATAIGRIAGLAGQREVAEKFLGKAAEIKRLVQEKLWNPDAQFFEVVPRRQDARWRDVREELGYTPWYFNLPDEDKSAAWSQIRDTNGFLAPYGPTTAERRSSLFRISLRGTQRNASGTAPGWPFCHVCHVDGAR